MSNSMSDRIKSLNSFIFHIFSENCRCFTSTCKINTGDPYIDYILDMLNGYQNPKSCKMFYDTGRLNYKQIFNRYLDYFVKMDLIFKGTNGYLLANNENLTWENIKAPHQDHCFCNPFQDALPVLMRFLQTAEAYKCADDCRIHTVLTPGQVHMFTQCLFWYLRKGIVDTLISWCYLDASLEAASVLTKSFHQQEDDRPVIIPRFSAVAGAPPPRLSAMTKSRTHQNLGTIAEDSPQPVSYSLMNAITSLFNPKKEYGCHAVSVGSLNLTSDYDVTLYGPCVTDVITLFNKLFGAAFFDSSSVVFDTNLYGSSFIELPEELSPQTPSRLFYGEVDCATDEFTEQKYMYVLSTDMISTPTHRELVRQVRGIPYDKDYITVAVLQQRLFALLKLSMWIKLFLQQEESGTNDLMRIMQSALVHLQNMQILQYLEHLFSKNDNMYISSPTREEASQENGAESIYKIYKNVGDMFTRSYTELEIATTPLRRRSSLPGEPLEILSYNDLPFHMVQKQYDYRTLVNMISIFNYFGSETYFTRGAFMHVVVSMQMCGGSRNGNPIFNDLSVSDLVNSFIENFADYVFHHGKRKYVKRMRDATSRMPAGAKDQLRRMLELFDKEETELQQRTPKEFLEFIHSCLDFILSDTATMFKGNESLILQATNGIEKTFLKIDRQMGEGKLQRPPESLGMMGGRHRSGGKRGGKRRVKFT